MNVMNNILCAILSGRLRKIVDDRTQADPWRAPLLRIKVAFFVDNGNRSEVVYVERAIRETLFISYSYLFCKMQKIVGVTGIKWTLRHT